MHSFLSMHPLLSGDGILPSPQLCEVRKKKYIYKISYHTEIKGVELKSNTHVQSYSFQRSIHSKGSWQMTLAHGLFDGQFLSKFRAIVA